MGKKYLETKETSLESSILGMWAEAAKKTEGNDLDEQLAKIKGKTPGDEGRRGAVEDDIERAEKKGDKKLVKKLKEDELDEGTKEEYQKFFNAAMKKFGIDSPADLKSDEEKKKFFDYVDKNYKGEKDEEFSAFMKEKL